MSTQPAKSTDNQARAELRAPDPRDGAKPPVVARAVPQDKELLADERQHLAQLFDRANVAHESAKQGALQFCRHSVVAGAALLEAQSLCPKRLWGAWLKDHFHGSARTAKRYMRQVKEMLVGGEMTDLSPCPSEELAWQFTAALARLERRRLADPAQGEQTAAAVPAGKPRQMLECASEPPPRDAGVTRKTILDLFDQLIAALRELIRFGKETAFERVALEELESVRQDVANCRGLIKK